MAHYARINEDWIVEQVIVVNNDVIKNDLGVECDWIGEQFCQSLYGAHTKWIQTSYNGRIYKNYAGVGYSFDPHRNAFIPPKPYESWVLNEETCLWDAPVPYPTDGKAYMWDEKTTNWVSRPEPSE